MNNYQGVVNVHQDRQTNEDIEEMPEGDNEESLA